MTRRIALFVLTALFGGVGGFFVGRETEPTPVKLLIGIASSTGTEYHQAIKDAGGIPAHGNQRAGRHDDVDQRRRAL